MVAILVLLTIVAFLTLDWLAQRRTARAMVTATGHVAAQPVPAPTLVSPDDLFRFPDDLFHAPVHTWLRLDPSGEVRLGAGGLPLVALGGVDAVELPRAGTNLRKGDTIAVLRRGDRTLALRSPVDGRIEGVNAALVHRAKLLELSPFEAGWLLRVRPIDLGAALAGLHLADAARTWLRREVVRFRDFLAHVAPAEPALATTLADGGLPRHGVAARLDDAEWRDLVRNFFDEPTLDGPNDLAP
jgi:glycine cleavage system H lipoate-binding protein